MNKEIEDRIQILNKVLKNENLTFEEAALILDSIKLEDIVHLLNRKKINVISKANISMEYPNLKPTIDINFEDIITQIDRAKEDLWEVEKVIIELPKSCVYGIPVEWEAES